MEEKPSYYAILPADVRYDPNLKDKAKLLYGEISALSNKTGECTATNNYFAKLFHITTKTVSRLIQNLKNSGYIRVIIKYKDDSKEVKLRIIKIAGQCYIAKQKGTDGDSSKEEPSKQEDIIENNEDDIDVTNNEGIPPNVYGYPQNCPEGIPKIVQDNNTSNNKKNTPYIPPREDDGYLQNFEKFWKAYPKKQDKKKSEAWFKRNKPNDELMKIILEKLELFKKTDQWKKSNHQFVPKPTTWLNGRRWEDEIYLDDNKDLTEATEDNKNYYGGYEVL